jgi:CHAT domain-containing protein
MSSTSLPDESIHIASAFHLAGFAHIIGTLWAIEDTAAVTISDRFYDSVSAGTGSTKHMAAALHQAVLAMRADSPDTPSRWASHIHIGP